MTKIPDTQTKLHHIYQYIHGTKLNEDMESDPILTAARVKSILDNIDAW